MREFDTIGHAWLAIATEILQKAEKRVDDGEAIRELPYLTLQISRVSPRDEVIERYGDPGWIAWMESNFFEAVRVPELGNARSYRERLWNHEDSGLDQLSWVVAKLKSKPGSKSATISLLEPLHDTRYVPCISLLDFWLRDGKLDMVVYARSLDFGKKAHGNLVCLARLMEEVAARLERPAGGLTLIVKSAHIYEEEVVALARRLDGATESSRVVGAAAL